MSIVAILVRDTIVKNNFFFAVNSYNTGCMVHLSLTGYFNHPAITPF